jgi:hypothetical protein
VGGFGVGLVLAGEISVSANDAANAAPASAMNILFGFNMLVLASEINYWFRNGENLVSEARPVREGTLNFRELSNDRILIDRTLKRNAASVQVLMLFE